MAWIFLAPFLFSGCARVEAREEHHRAHVRLIDNAIAWDDLRVPLTATRQGALAKPDFDSTNVGYLFPQNDATEILYFIAQVPHSWAYETGLEAHVHWQQSAATAVNWCIDYKVIQLDTLTPAGWSTLCSTSGAFSYTAGNLHQLTELGSVSMVGITSPSAIILGKLYRSDNTTVGDVLAWEFDFHYQLDGFGTDTEYTK